MTEITQHIPSYLNSAIINMAKNANVEYSEIVREALVDFILNKKSATPMHYDDSDDDILKNIMASTSFTLFEEENARNN